MIFWVTTFSGHPGHTVKVPCIDPIHAVEQGKTESGKARDLSTDSDGLIYSTSLSLSLSLSFSLVYLSNVGYHSQNKKSVALVGVLGVSRRHSAIHCRSFISFLPSIFSLRTYLTPKVQKPLPPTTTSCEEYS
jgi:hypothetical protein